MKIITYSAVIKQSNTGRIWVEEYSDLVVDDMTELRHCQFLIKRFNETLRPRESPREVVNVRPIIKNLNRNHKWQKVSLVTEKGGYDVYRCAICGATGKRYGLAGFVTPDRKFTIFCK